MICHYHSIPGSDYAGYAEYRYVCHPEGYDERGNN